MRFIMVYHRARRALIINALAATLTRVVGGNDLFQALPAWLRCKSDILTAMREQDFIDPTRRETQESVDERLAKVGEILEKRGSAFTTVAQIVCFTAL